MSKKVELLKKCVLRERGGNSPFVVTEMATQHSNYNENM